MQVIYICKATFLITAFYNVPILVIALVTLKISFEGVAYIDLDCVISIFLSLFCLLLFISMFSASVHSGE